jgi:hypothetical protein
MSTTVSKSPKPEDKVPSRKERDDSYSTGAGKKAVEVPKSDRDRSTSSKNSGKTKSEEKLEPPIGLDNETKADKCSGSFRGSAL